MTDRKSKPYGEPESTRFPSDPEEARFCRQARTLGILTPAQIDECSQMQESRANQGMNNPIAFILLEKGYVDTDQIQKIRDAQKKVPATPTAPPPGPSAPASRGEAPEYGSEEDDRKREDHFAKLAIKLGFISDKEIQECKADREKGKAKKGDPLGFLLLGKGYLTSHQIRHINEEVKKTLGKPRIGGYELDTELGRGAMGVVFKSKQLSLDREVALKVIPKTITSSRDFKERFFREARTAAKLNHPNIVKAIDAGETARHFFFAMELIPGKTLLQVIRKKKRLQEGRALDLTIQVTKALQHAHQHGLVHRDIKPENLLIDPESGLIKLTDMGLAKSTEDKDSAITQEGTTVGTPYYISPEQVAAKADVDIRADIYALGGTLYHMLVGSPPFTGDSPVLVIKKHLDEKPSPPKLRNPAISTEINRIVMKMLEKPREKRYANPGALLEDLERLRRVGPEKAAVATGAKAPTSGVSRTLPKARKKPFPVVPVIAGGAVLVAVIVIAASFMGGGGGGENDGKKKPSSSNTGSSDPEDHSGGSSREKESREVLEQANIYARNYPNQFDRILTNYKEILDKFPRTSAYTAAKKAIKQIEARRGQEIQDALDRVKTNARRLAGGEDFSAALEALDEFPTSLRNLEVEAALRLEEGNLRKEAERAMQGRIDLAATAAARGNFDEAVATLKGVEKFGMPGLTEKVKPIIEAYEKEKQTSAFRDLHLRVLDRIAASDLTGGRQFLEDELQKIQDYELKDYLRRDILNIGKAEAVWRSVLVRGPARSGLHPVRLKSGDVLLAEMKAQGDKLILKGPEGDRTVRVSDLASPEVRAIAAASPLNAACFAWYVNRDIRYLLELAGGKTDGPGDLSVLARLALSCARAGFQSDLASFSESTLDAARMFSMLGRWGGLPFFTSREDELRLLTARSLEGAHNPFLFGTGPGRGSEGKFRLSYDFTSPYPFGQFLTTGRGNWDAGWGTLTQKARGAGQIQAFLPGVWTSFRIEMSVIVEDPLQGVGFTFHQKPDGSRYAFEARKRGNEVWVAFYFRPPSCPAMFLLGAPLKIQEFNAEKCHSISLTVKEGVFLGSFDGENVRVDAQDRRPRSEEGHMELSSGRLGIRASSPVTVRLLSMEGTPEFGWVSNLPGTEHLAGLTSNGAGSLFDGASLKGWEVLTGKANVRNKSIHLDGPMSTISHASGTVFDGRQNMQIAFEARRVSGVAFLLAGFRFGRIPRLMAVRPHKDDPYPAELPPGVLVVDAPIGDGQWHQFMLMEGPEGASLWVDRVKRYLVDTKDIIKWGHSEFHIWGLGFGTAGGAWEIRNIVSTRKSF